MLLPVEFKLLLHGSLVLEEGLLVPPRVNQCASLLFSGRSLLREIGWCIKWVLVEAFGASCDFVSRFGTSIVEPWLNRAEIRLWGESALLFNRVEYFCVLAELQDLVLFILGQRFIQSCSCIHELVLIKGLIQLLELLEQGSKGSQERRWHSAQVDIGRRYLAIFVSV